MRSKASRSFVFAEREGSRSATATAWRLRFMGESEAIGTALAQRLPNAEKPDAGHNPRLDVIVRCPTRVAGP